MQPLDEQSRSCLEFAWMGWSGPGNYVRLSWSWQGLTCQGSLLHLAIIEPAPICLAGLSLAMFDLAGRGLYGLDQNCWRPEAKIC